MWHACGNSKCIWNSGYKPWKRRFLRGLCIGSKIKLEQMFHKFVDWVKLAGFYIYSNDSHKALMILNRCNTRDCRFESHSEHRFMSAIFCVWLSCVGKGLAVSRSLIWGVLPYCLNGVIVWKLNSESEQASRPNP